MLVCIYFYASMNSDEYFVTCDMGSHLSDRGFMRQSPFTLRVEELSLIFAGYLLRKDLTCNNEFQVQFHVPMSALLQQDNNG